MTTRRKAAGVALKLLISLGVFAVGLEIAFRICPWAVPAKALVHFEPALRAKLAQGRFPTRADTILLPRDDGGDAIRIFCRLPSSRTDFGVRHEQLRGRPGGEDRRDRVWQSPGIYDAHAKIDLVAIGDSFTWSLGGGIGTPRRSGWAKGWDARRTIWAGAATVRTNTCRS